MESKKLQTALEKWNAIQPLSELDRERLTTHAIASHEDRQLQNNQH